MRDIYIFLGFTRGNLENKIINSIIFIDQRILKNKFMDKSRREKTQECVIFFIFFCLVNILICNRLMISNIFLN